MNIAIIIGELGGGGAERAAQLLGDYLLKENNRVYYFVFDSSYIMTEVQSEVVFVDVDVKEIELSNDDQACLKKSLLRNANILKKYKIAYSIDVAISFMEDSNYLNILSKRNEKVIISVRTVISYRDDLKGYLKNKSLISDLYPKADCVVAVSEAVREDLCGNFDIEESKISVIPNPSIKKESLVDTLWEYGEKAIVCVARLDPVKQQDRIIRSFSEVVKEIDEAKLILIGDGKLRNYLEWVSKKMGLSDSVVFVGYTYDVGYYLKHARVFTMASRAEGFPNSMVEAMAYGVPVVTTASPGGVLELVGGNRDIQDVKFCKYGIVTPYMKGKASRNIELEREERMLGSALIQLLKDEELYNKYSCASEKRAMDYSKEQIMNKWGKVVSE